MPIEVDKLFVSAKTLTPIPYRGALDRLALIRATLDPEVASISPLPNVGGEEPAPVRALATVVGQDGPVVLCVGAPDGSGRPSPPTPSVLYPAADLMADPLAANLGLVWSCARRWVSPGDQVRVLHFLDENGASALIDAAQAATASVDGVATVLALACRNLVEIDLDDAPLGPGTRVRRRDA